jgi:hypothetical protein
MAMIFALIVVAVLAYLAKPSGRSAISSGTVFGLLVGFLIFAVRAATGHGLHFGIILKAAVLGFVIGLATEGFAALVDRIRRD